MKAGSLSTRDRRDLAALLMRKAAGDTAALRSLVDVSEVPDEVLGFHAQQAVEKTLKAVLAASAVEYPRTHNIAVLVGMLEDAGVRLPAELAEVDELTPWAVQLRYEEQMQRTLDRPSVLELVTATSAWATRELGDLS